MSVNSSIITGFLDVNWIASDSLVVAGYEAIIFSLRCRGILLPSLPYLFKFTEEVRARPSLDKIGLRV